MRVDFARSIGKRRNSVFFCRLLGVEVLASMLFVSVCSGQQPTTPSPIPTNRSDNARSGANVNETILTPSNVNKNQFGALFNYPIDYLALAQPLYVPNVNIPGKGTHNVVYVATMADSVYAFDADSNAGSNATPLWWVNFTNPAIYGPGITTANTAQHSALLGRQDHRFHAGRNCRDADHRYDDGHDVRGGEDRCKTERFTTICMRSISPPGRKKRAARSDHRHQYERQGARHQLSVACTS